MSQKEVNMYERFFCIPTHREILDEFLDGFYKEVTYINSILNIPCPLVIFEDTNKNINKDKILSFKKKYTNCTVHYVTRQDVEKIYDIILYNLCKEDKIIFRKLYPNPNVNYGNVFNRIFIFATLLGADYIHRRDSDIVSDIDQMGEYCFPAKIEVSALWKEKNNKIAYIVGGGYKGKYSLDIDDLINGDDLSLIKDLCTCISIPEEYHDDVIQNEFLNNNFTHLFDSITHN